MKDHGHYTQELEHDATYRVKKVSNFVADGSGNLVREVSNDTALKAVPHSVTANVTYIGKAAPGTATSAAGWQIKKLDESNGTDITWADGNTAFDNVWDNRESLSYS